MKEYLNSRLLGALVWWHSMVTGWRNAKKRSFIFRDRPDWFVDLAMRWAHESREDPLPLDTQPHMRRWYREAEIEYILRQRRWVLNLARIRESRVD